MEGARIVPCATAARWAGARYPRARRHRAPSLRADAGVDEGHALVTRLGGTEWAPDGTRVAVLAGVLDVVCRDLAPRAIIPSMPTPTWIRVLFALCLVSAVAAVSASRAVAQDPLALVKEGRTLEQAGQLGEGLDRYRKAVAANPTLFEAQLALGRALNLAGDYAPARQALQQALALSTEANRNTALAALGVSYAFEGRAAESEKYYKQTYVTQLAAGQFEEAGATANAIARVYLEAGDADGAATWYRAGHETAQKASAAAPAAVDLREWRWLNAQGRMAARKGQVAAARQFAAQGKAILDKGTNADQAAYYPYLVGYIEFYAKNYARAIEELLKADQRDVFILGLLAQAYDKTGAAAAARETFAKVMASPSYSINAAYARPLARQYLAR